LDLRLSIEDGSVVHSPLTSQSKIANPKSQILEPLTKEEEVQQIYHHTFPNGLTLVAERMDHVRSAAFYFLVPAGCIYDPPEHRGIASVLSDLIMRGAGPRDSRELSTALDNLGIDHSESVGGLHLRFWGATLSRNLLDGLTIYADILRRPRLPEEEVDPVRSLALQDLVSLEDEPAQKLFIELRQRHFPPPLGQDSRGTEKGIKSLNIKVLRSHHRRLVRPRGTILSVAGNIDWDTLRDHVGRLFGDWEGGEEPNLQLGQAPGAGHYSHVPKETTQTQIGIAYQSVPFGHPDYYNALGAVNVLDGGMSARLFTEVREKHGLCYSISASYQTYRDRASILCYAGTTNERAQRTLDLTLNELTRLKDGIEPDEVERVRVGLKSSLIKAEESTTSRAGTLASDWYYLGRIRSFDEIQSAINGLTPESIVAYLRRQPPGNFTIVTLGPEPLKVGE
jgi:predicted Zn-dependent peptidase